jgi:hypothetical protein
MQDRLGEVDQLAKGSTQGGRFMRRFTCFAMVATALLTVPAVASAAKHHSANAVAGCTVSGGTVSATGLPTDQVINFMVTDASGTSGWVLGFTPDGTWSVAVPAPNGATTYEFVSRTFGSNGSKYTVFASC